MHLRTLLLISSIAALSLIAQQMQCAEEQDSSENIQYIDLRSESFVLGVCPSVGGRIYKLIADEQNIIPWNETLLYHWNRPGHYGYHLYGGNELWLSPQSQWKKTWPPNMSLSTNNWTINEQSSKHITLTSNPQKDDVWQAKREIKILSANSFSNTITLSNISDNEQSAGIWFMNRCPRDVKVHFPHNSVGKDELSKNLQQKNNVAGVDVQFINHMDYRPGKVYYTTAENYCFITRNGVRWRVDISFSPDGAPHKEQGDFEIARDLSLIEVEYHGPYTKVASKASISATETWTVTELNKQ